MRTVCRAIATAPLLVAALATVACPSSGIPTARAADVQRGEQIVIDSGTTIDDDLYLVALRATINGRVDGDVAAAGAFVNAVGPINGDLIVTAGRAEVRGPVSGDVRATGANIAVYGDVAGDVVVASGSVTLVEGAVVDGDLVVTSGAVTIVQDATVRGDLRGIAVDVTIEGWVAGDVNLTVRHLDLAPGARIDGTLRYVSAAEAEVGSGAVVGGPVERTDPAEVLPLGAVLLWHNGALPRLLAMLVAGALLLLLIPRRIQAAANAARVMPIETLSIGLALAVALPIVLVFIAMTVVGLPLALIGAAGAISALYLSQAVIGLAVGRLLLRHHPEESRRRADMTAMAVGVIAIAGLRIVPAPGADIAISLLTAMYGLGAIAIALKQRGLPAKTSLTMTSKRSVEPDTDESVPEHEIAEQTSLQSESASRSTRTVKSIGREVVAVVAGLLLGFAAIVAAVIASSASASWLVWMTLAVGTNINPTITVDRTSLAVVALMAAITSLGAVALAVAIYRRSAVKG